MEALQPSPSLASAFIPVQVAASVKDIAPRNENVSALDLKVHNSGGIRQAPAKSATFSSVAKLNVSLPNGVKPSLECDDVRANVRALTAAIGAVSDV